MSIKKQYSESDSVCRVTFKLDKELTEGVKQVYLTGEFNNWDEKNILMKKQKNGEYAVSLNLKKGKEYQYKYLINGNNWLNDSKADKYLPNAFQSTNSVVVV